MPADTFMGPVTYFPLELLYYRHVLLFLCIYILEGYLLNIPQMRTEGSYSWTTNRRGKALIRRENRF